PKVGRRGGRKRDRLGEFFGPIVANSGDKSFLANCGESVFQGLDATGRDALVSPLRRARSASRPKPSRAAVGGSRKSVGGVDESETGSANSLVRVLPT